MNVVELVEVLDAIMDALQNSQHKVAFFYY
jgi:hypothetical protein